MGFSHTLIAQENVKNPLSFSFGIPMNIVNNDAEMGLNINFLVFKNSNFGYYINLYGLIYSIRSIDSVGVDFGIITGVGYKKTLNNYLGFYTGIGPEIRFSNDTYDDTYEHLHIGIGIGGTLEIRLQIKNNISFAGGVLVRSNYFYNNSDYNILNIISVQPFIGISWN